MTNEKNEKRVFNLMREITTRQEQLKISKGLMDIKFNLKKLNFKEIHKTVIKKVFKPIVEDNKMSDEEKINKLLSLLNTGNIEIDINILCSKDYTEGLKKPNSSEDSCYDIWEDAERNNKNEEYERKLAIDVVSTKGFSKKKRPSKEYVAENGTPIKVTVRDYDGSNEKSFISMLNLSFSKTVHTRGKTWSLCSSFVYRKIIDLATVLSIVYVANELHNYVESNQELRAYILLKGLLDSECSQQMPNQESFDTVNRLLEMYNLPKIDTFIGVGDNQFVEWLSKERLFMMKDVFNSITENIYIYTHGYNFDRLVRMFLREMIRENETIKADCKRRQNIATSYARSYETKQNIPKKIQNKMNHNKFLKWFGYVEFDELCDLKKILHIEKEFVKYADFINLPIMKDHSLRFRRLGHHKASGLYYPSARAVCIDIRYAYSMVHELFHMIDYTTLQNECLSNLINFRAIFDKYIQLTDEKASSLPEDSLTRREWFGKNKYNKDYYQTPTEIFARCGELYIVKVLGIKNSLCAIDLLDSELYYPEDKEFLKMVEKYFITILGEVGEYNKHLDIGVASKVGGTSNISDVDISSVVNIELYDTENGQLSLFEC